MSSDDVSVVHCDGPIPDAGALMMWSFSVPTLSIWFRRSAALVERFDEQLPIAHARLFCIAMGHA